METPELLVLDSRLESFLSESDLELRLLSGLQTSMALSLSWSLSLLLT